MTGSEFQQGYFIDRGRRIVMVDYDADTDTVVFEEQLQAGGSRHWVTLGRATTTGEGWLKKSMGQRD